MVVGWHGSPSLLACCRQLGHEGLRAAGAGRDRFGQALDLTLQLGRPCWPVRAGLPWRRPAPAAGALAPADLKLHLQDAAWSAQRLALTLLIWQLALSSTRGASALDPQTQIATQ